MHQCAGGQGPTDPRIPGREQGGRLPGVRPYGNPHAAGYSARIIPAGYQPLVAQTAGYPTGPTRATDPRLRNAQSRIDAGSPAQSHEAVLSQAAPAGLAADANQQLRNQLAASALLDRHTPLAHKT